MIHSLARKSDIETRLNRTSKVHRFLSVVLGFSETDIEHLHKLFQSSSDTDFLEFLTSKRILTPAAYFLIDLPHDTIEETASIRERSRGPASLDFLQQSKTEKIKNIETSHAQKSDSLFSTSPNLPESPFAKFNPGNFIGNIRIIDKIGEGASGVVHRAHHTRLNMTVAVKFLRPDSSDNSPAGHRTLGHEATLLARLNHPNVVRVWDFEDDPDCPHIVLEYVDGPNVGELVQRAGSIQEKQAVKIIADAARGLGICAQSGVIHRDIKPANILLDKEGVAKVADMGISVSGATLASAKSTSGLVGTAAYVSPEQAREPESVNHRSDIYSLGITFYEMLTGRLPFVSRNVMKTLRMHQTSQAPRADAVCPSVSKRTADLIQRMMAKNPDDRPADYTELITELDSIAHDLP